MRARNRISSALAACIAGVVIAGCGSYGGPPSHGPLSVTPLATSPQAAVGASNALGLKLLSRLDPGHNTVISPYSLQLSLATLMQGARGQTLTQMERVMNSSTPRALAAANRALASNVAVASSAFPEQGHPTLDTAAGLWLQSGLPVQVPFTSTLAGYFGAAVNQVDFQQPVDAIAAINAWAGAHTGGLIINLLNSASVSAQTKLVLTSAIDLKAQWEHPFAPSTNPQPFRLADGTSVTVPMMVMPRAATIPYAQTTDYQAVELPYHASNLAMLAVLPAQGKLDSVLQSLNVQIFQQLEASLRSSPQLVAMPKVSVALQANLASQLAAIGMPAAFTSSADFSGITDATALQLQSVDHAAVMDVYQRGTSAAAATGTSIGPSAVEVSRPTITFNRPYYLFLIDRSTGAALFAARIVNPD